MPSDEADRHQADSIFKLLYGDAVIGRLLPIQDYTDSLYPGEANLIHQASQKRRLEFSSGRACAKQALAELGVENFPVLRNEHRDPVWPAGVVGSISHCRDLCGAVVARNSDFESLGFDIENIKPLTFNIAEHICTEQETFWLAKQPSSSIQTMTLLLFSLKEAVFKCIYPASRLQLGFKDCSIRPDLETHCADIVVHLENHIPQPALQFHITQKHVYSAAFLTQSEYYHF